MPSHACSGGFGFGIGYCSDKVTEKSVYSLGTHERRTQSPLSRNSDGHYLTVQLCHHGCKTMKGRRP